MKPRALVISPSKDPAHIGYGDARAAVIGFGRAGYEVDFAPLKDLASSPDSTDVAAYDLICYQIPANAQFASTSANYRFFTRLHGEAKDGALTLQYCDITFGIDPNIWDPTVGREQTKINLMADRPVRIMGSFSVDILEDADAMALISKRVLSRIHPDSSFIPIEWNTLTYAVAEERGAFKAEQDQAPTRTQPINRFYYGLDKRKVVPSLKALGLGQSEDDAVVGSIAKSFPQVRNLGDSDRGGRHPWKHHANSARSVLVPYEPIKGDYQATLRFLEALEFYPDKAEVDPRVADWMQPMVSEHEPWRERMAEAVERMADLHSKKGVSSSRQHPDSTNASVGTKSPSNPRRSNMANETFRLSEVDGKGNRVARLLSRTAIIEHLAPGFDLDDPVDTTDANKWLDAFLKDKLSQKARGVELRSVDVKTLSKELDEKLIQKEAEIAEIKTEVAEIAAQLLYTITEEEIAEGDIYDKFSTQGPKKVGIVELQRQKTGKSASVVLSENPNLPAHVEAVLTAKADADGKATAKRMAGEKLK